MDSCTSFSERCISPLPTGTVISYNHALVIISFKHVLVARKLERRGLSIYSLRHGWG